MKKIEFYLESCLENPPNHSSDYILYEITEDNEAKEVGDIHFEENDGWHLLGYKISDEDMKGLYYLVRRVVDA